MVLKSQQQTQQAPSDSIMIGDMFRTFWQPDFLPVGVLLFLAMILAIINLNSKKHGHLANAREGNQAELKAAVKKAIDRIQNPKLTNAVFCITEPIGTPIPEPLELAKYKGRITPILDINRATLVVGAPGCGKTANVINPAIRWAIKMGYRVMLFDAKYPEQAEQIVPYAIDCGSEVSVYAPGYEESATFNILDAVEDENDSTTADQVVMTLRNNLGGDDKTNSFFETGGQGMVAGAILLAKRAARLANRPEVANLLLVDEIISMHDLTARLIANRDDISRAAYRSFTQYLSAHADTAANDTSASLRSTAASIMKPLVSSRFVDSIAGFPDFPCFHADKPFWIGEKNLVVFGVNQDLKGVVLPLIATAIEQVGNYNLNSSRRSSTPLAIFLDEVAQLNLPVALDSWGPEKRSVGCCLVMGLQYVDQITETYGEEAVAKVLGAANKFFFNPGSVKTAKTMSEECGNKEVLIGSISKSRSSGQHSSSSSSESDQIQSVALFDPLVFSQLAVGTCVYLGAAVTTGRGKEERVGLPYKIRFERLNDECDRQEALNKKRYAEMVKRAIANKKSRSPEGLDYTAQSKEYRHLAEDYLPLKKSSSSEALAELEIETKKPAQTPAKKPSQFVWLKGLIEMAEYYKWQLEGDSSDRKVPIPNEWGDDISVSNLAEALEIAGMKILSKGEKK
jgi:TraM recognition site of TraD and TraG